MTPSFAENLARLDARIQKALARAGRNDRVQLIAVSKFHAQQAVEEALTAGVRVFGENRVQEAAGKFPPLQRQFADLRLHMIGPLQTNKVAEAVRLFDVIQTLDRPALAKALAKAFEKGARKPDLYIEVNIGAEPQKAGVLPEDLPPFFESCRAEYGLTPKGLMCIPPAGQPAAPFFQQMRRWADRLGLLHLSMGMTADFEEAIACGATEIRVGTALFGQRPPVP